MHKPPLFLHVDLDGLWTLPACYGYAEGASYEHDPVFEIGIERLLELLRQAGIRGTFFIVGRDLELPAKRDRIARIASAGHALANHSWSHAMDLGSRPAGEITTELRQMNDQLEELGGTKPLGFRAPGYAANSTVLEAVAAAGLVYDGSAFPSPWGPLLRRAGDRLRRAVQEGQPVGTGIAPTRAQPGQYGFAGWSLAPRRATTAAGPLLRLPVAVTPWLRLPLQASIGLMMGEARVEGGLRALAQRNHPITWLLHGLDVLGTEDLEGHLPPGMARHPAFRVTRARKLEFLRHMLACLHHIGEVQRTEDWLHGCAPSYLR